MRELVDLHCHILPGIDDGAADFDDSLEMARHMVEAGYGRVAASPHMGEGPGGNASIDAARQLRAELQERLNRAGIEVVSPLTEYLFMSVVTRLYYKTQAEVIAQTA